MKLEILGVYPVDGAEEPCHLLEWKISGHHGPFDVASLRQPNPGQPEANWQAPYDEHLLSPDGRAAESVFGPFEVAGKARFCFFFHYLNTEVPFESPAGRISVPTPTQRPAHLALVAYEPPC
jgi:hypothetical protein